MENVQYAFINIRGMYHMLSGYKLVTGDIGLYLYKKQILHLIHLVIFLNNVVFLVDLVFN